MRHCVNGGRVRTLARSMRHCVNERPLAACSKVLQSGRIKALGPKTLFSLRNGIFQN